MAQLKIEMSDDRLAFMPGQTIQGRFVWTLDRDVQAVEVRLIWFTHGKGTQDVSIVATRRVEKPARSGQDAFEFKLPVGPYSFTGKLITLSWALELLTLPGDQAERIDFILSPTEHWVVLPTTVAPKQL